MNRNIHFIIDGKCSCGNDWPCIVRQESVTMQELNKTAELEQTASNPLEHVVMCAFAGLYQRIEPRQTVSKVVAILVPFEKDDDEFAIKAKAERYVNEDEKLNIDTKDMNLVAWSYRVEQKNT